MTNEPGVVNQWKNRKKFLKVAREGLLFGSYSDDYDYDVRKIQINLGFSRLPILKNIIIGRKLKNKSYSIKNVSVGVYLKPNSSLVCDLAYLHFFNLSFRIGCCWRSSAMPYTKWYLPLLISFCGYFQRLCLPSNSFSILCKEQRNCSKMFEKKNKACQKLPRKIRQEPFFLPKKQWDINDEL